MIRTLFRSLLAAFAALSLAATGAHDPPPLNDPIPGTIATSPVTVTLASVTAGFTFPTDVTEIPDGSARLVVSERGGRLWLIDNAQTGATPYLDLSATTVINPAGGTALSSVAFHPEYANAAAYGSRRLYTASQEVAGSGTAHFGDPASPAHQSVLYEWRVDGNDDTRVDPASRREIPAHR